MNARKTDDFLAIMRGRLVAMKFGKKTRCENHRQIAPRVGCDEVVVRIRGLRIFVQQFHKRVCGCGIEIEVVLLYVFSMIALAVRQSEHSLLEDRVPAVPESDGKTQTLLLVADAGDTIFAPMIGTPGQRTSVEGFDRLSAHALRVGFITEALPRLLICKSPVLDASPVAPMMPIGSAGAASAAAKRPLLATKTGGLRPAAGGESCPRLTAD